MCSCFALSADMKLLKGNRKSTVTVRCVAGGFRGNPGILVVQSLLKYIRAQARDSLLAPGS